MYRKEKESQVVRCVKGSDHMSYSAQLSHVSRLIARAGVTCCGKYILVAPRFGCGSHEAVHSARYIYMYILFVTPARTEIQFSVAIRGTVYGERKQGRHT